MNTNDTWNNSSELYSAQEDLEVACFCFSNFFPFLIQEIPRSLRKKHLGLIQFPSLSNIRNAKLLNFNLT